MIPDFVKGRITSPMLCPYVDLKLCAFKAANVSWVSWKFPFLFSFLGWGGGGGYYNSFYPIFNPGMYTVSVHNSCTHI